MRCAREECIGGGFKASIITLTYRDLSGIYKTIDSVFSQKVDFSGKVEYIIADDGSENLPENFFDGLKRYVLEEFNSTIVLRHAYSNGKNLGTVKSFNNAVRKASGEIVIPLSCGDVFSNEYSVSKIVEAFENSEMNIFTSYRNLVKDDGAIQRLPYNYQVKKMSDRDGLLRYLSVYGNFVSGASTYYRRSFIDDMGGFDETYRLLEDYPFYVKSLSLGFDIGFIDDVLMIHQWGGVSTASVSSKSPLDGDNLRLRVWVKRNIKMTFFEKRLFYYFQELSRSEKIRLRNLIGYFDCFCVRAYHLLVCRLFK